MPALSDLTITVLRLVGAAGIAATSALLRKASGPTPPDDHELLNDFVGALGIFPHPAATTWKALSLRRPITRVGLIPGTEGALSDHSNRSARLTVRSGETSLQRGHALIAKRVRHLLASPRLERSLIWGVP